MSCQTQQIKTSEPNLYIGDLRDLYKTNGQRSNHNKLLVLNVNKKQTVFEITEKNSMALSNIPQSYIEDLGIVMNDTGNFDTKYDSIIILTLKKKALEIINTELKDKLK